MSDDADIIDIDDDIDSSLSDAAEDGFNADIIFSGWLSEILARVIYRGSVEVGSERESGGGGSEGRFVVSFGSRLKCLSMPAMLYLPIC